MFSLEGDFSQALGLLEGMLAQAENFPKFLKGPGTDILKASNKRSFRQQRTPWGETWSKSLLSQIDPTGSPRLTLIRSTTGFQESQDDKNYILKGNTLEEYNLAKSSGKGGDFYYMQHHNENRWPFAGLDSEGIDTLQDQGIDFIFGDI
jgi:hypothetical protein